MWPPAPEHRVGGWHGCQCQVDGAAPNPRAPGGQAGDAAPAPEHQAGGQAAWGAQALALPPGVPGHRLAPTSPSPSPELRPQTKSCRAPGSRRGLGAEHGRGHTVQFGEAQPPPAFAICRPWTEPHVAALLMSKMGMLHKEIREGAYALVE